MTEARPGPATRLTSPSSSKKVASAAALVHGAAFASRYAARFLDVLAPTRLTLYGSPSDEVKAALAPFTPVLMQPAAGFSR